MDDAEALRLRRAVSRLARALNSSAADQGLTPTQASLLAIIATDGPIGMTELQHIEQINPTMLSRSVTRLDQLGLVERSSDPDDQRSVKAKATQRGRELLHRIMEQRAEVVTRAMALLDPAHRDSLSGAVEALEALAAAAHQMTTPLT